MINAKLLDVAKAILADDLLPYLPAEYIARVQEVIAEADAEKIPDGWQLVPLEPTPAMLDAAAHASMQHLLDCIADPEKAKEVGSEENTRLTHASRYRSMIAAAPKVMK